MDNVVPGALQRLREADIISMAGLTGASLGQEYCRIGAVHSTKRHGARLTGIVDVPSTVYKEAASPSIGADEAEQAATSPGHYLVEIEARDHSSWNATCTCVRYPGLLPLCPHAAALLYQWLAHPMYFLPPSPSSPLFPASISSAAPLSTASPLKNEKAPLLSKQARPVGLGQPTSTSPFRGTAPPGNLDETLALLGLSELRNIARE